RTVISVGPAVIRAAEVSCAPIGFRDDGGGVVPADVVKGAELAIIAAHNDQGLLVDVDGEELAGVLDLVEMANDLPVGGEDGVAFELRDAFVEIPGGRNGPGLFERVAGVIEVEDIAKRALGHSRRLQ